MTKRAASPPPEERPSLLVSAEEAASALAAQIQSAETLLKTPIPTFDELRAVRSKYKVWHDYAAEYLRSIATNDSLAREFSRVGVSVGSLGPPVLHEEIDDLHRDVHRDIDRIMSIRERLGLFSVAASQPRKAGAAPAIAIESILRRFHLVARQLRSRHDGRPTLDINDEYDVQDLVHALLRSAFDDIRSEEWTPSYAGGSSRMDFLLKKEQTVIEIKKTRQGVADRQIGDQLLEDIGRYAVHQDCRSLFCFVYDPEGRIANPDGLEADLSHSRGELSVRVIVAPKGH